MTLDPGPPRRNPSGGLGGAAPQWVRVLGSRPPSRVRVRPHYPELPVPGPRRDIGWVWDWVLGLGNISRILENVADLVVH